jgi:hypothetical protein
MTSVVLRVRARTPAKVHQHTLAVAFIIIFPVIALEQLLHTSPTALRALPVYEALHWLSDALMALPLGVIAVLAGDRLARHFRIRLSSTADVFARACMIALALSLLLIPGGALHDAADSLTHSHAVLGVHSHAALAANAAGPQTFVTNVLHNLTDGLEGQLVGLPAAFLALLWVRRSHQQRSRRSVSQL